MMFELPMRYRFLHIWRLLIPKRTAFVEKPVVIKCLAQRGKYKSIFVELLASGGEAPHDQD